jgi:hypothetical protein
MDGQRFNFDVSRSDGAQKLERGDSVSWARIDDKLTFNPKVLRAGNEAMGAWLRMLAYASCHMTDGFVDVSMAQNIAEKRSVLERLCAVGLLREVEGGYAIHDYLKFNHSKEQIEAKKEENAERQRRYREGKDALVTRYEHGDKTRDERVARRVSHHMGMGSVSQGVLGGTEPLALTDGLPDLGKPANATQRKLVDAHVRDALRVLEELNAARKRVDPATRGIKPSYASLAKISERLEEGATVEDCLHVVAVGEHESTGTTPQALTSRGFFDAISPFRQENFQRKLQRTAKKSASSKPMTPGEQLQAEIEAREAEEYRRRGVG